MSIAARLALSASTTPPLSWCAGRSCRPVLRFARSIQCARATCANSSGRKSAAGGGRDEHRVSTLSRDEGLSCGSVTSARNPAITSDRLADTSTSTYQRGAVIGWSHLRRWPRLPSGSEGLISSASNPRNNALVASRIWSTSTSLLNPYRNSFVEGAKLADFRADTCFSVSPHRVVNPDANASPSNLVLFD